MTFYRISLLLYVLSYFVFLNFALRLCTSSILRFLKKCSILRFIHDIRDLNRDLIYILLYEIVWNTSQDLDIANDGYDEEQKWESETIVFYLLESAGEGGFRVSGEQHSLGDGDLSRLVTGSKCRPAGPWCPAASVLLILWSWPPCMAPCPPPATPSTGMPFSERNSSRSTYCQQRSEMSFPRWLLGDGYVKFEQTYLTLLGKLDRCLEYFNGFINNIMQSYTYK